MPDEVAPTVARIQRRVQEDRDEDAAFRIVEDPGHDDSNQYCHNDLSAICTTIVISPTF